MDRASARRSHPTLSAGPVYKRDVDSGADRSRPGLLLWLDRPTPLSGMCTMLLRLRKCRRPRTLRVDSIPVFPGIEATYECGWVFGIFSNLDMWTMQVQGDDTLPYLLARSVFMLMRCGEAGRDVREVCLDDRTDRLHVKSHPGFRIECFV